jgi:hypothetical protein
MAPVGPLSRNSTPGLQFESGTILTACRRCNSFLTPPNPIEIYYVAAQIAVFNAFEKDIASCSFSSFSFIVILQNSTVRYVVRYLL